MSPPNMRVTVVAGVSLTGNVYPSGRTGSNPWAPSPCQGRDPATVVVRDILDLVGDFEVLSLSRYYISHISPSPAGCERGTIRNNKTVPCIPYSASQTWYRIHPSPRLSSFVFGRRTRTWACFRAPGGSIPYGHLFIATLVR